VIGVAISTHQRPHILAKALGEWAKYMPDILVVIHDINGEGIAATKNRSITALMDAQCEHLFLADDDVWPITSHWADHYTQDPELHLMHCWGQRRLISNDGHYTTWKHPRGVLLYLDRKVVETVGGMRPEFGKWGGEHVEYSQRIHNAGLTTNQYADLSVCAQGVWHAEDYTRMTPSSVSDEDRIAYVQRKRVLFRTFAGSKGYVEYRR
jgi:hypothetical protein